MADLSGTHREAALASEPDPPAEKKSGTPPIDAIATFAPWASENERALRRRIHRAHGSAMARAQRSRHGRARAIFWLAAQMSGDWTFARAATEDLEDVLKTLSYLFLAAGAIERVEAPDER